MADENTSLSDSDSVILIEDGEIADEEEPKQETEAKPIFEVVFWDTDCFQKYGDTIVKVLKEHLLFDGEQLNFLKNSDTNESNYKKKCAGQILAFEPITDNNEESKTFTTNEDCSNCDQNSNDSQDFGVDLNNLFTIDPSPSTTLESSKVPSYKRAVKELLDEKINKPSKETLENACPRPKPSTACFNCGALDHGLRDCPMPRSAKRINRAKQSRSGKERYHVDADQRYAHLRPGVISEKLQKALRLRHGELPSFFYRMRVFGYPPGWLEDAKVSHSGLLMFNSGDDVLKGEDNSSDSESEVKYDVSKIIEFPGFNFSPGTTFYDDYKHYNVPPISRRQTREEMINALGDRAIKGFKRKKLKDDSLQVNDNNLEVCEAVIEPHDMEIEDANTSIIENVQFTRPMPPPLPPSNEMDECPPLPPADDSNSVAETTLSLRDSPLNTERADSPTLDELQERQRALLLKLECSDDFQNDEDLPLDKINCTNIPSAPSTPVTPAAAPSTPLPYDTEMKNIIKSSHMGTPVLQFSPFEKLPSGDNFKKGVSDVINFENLPDSTGKYEAMKDVIKKVRNIKRQLTVEDS